MELIKITLIVLYHNNMFQFIFNSPVVPKIGEEIRLDPEFYTEHEAEILDGEDSFIVTEVTHVVKGDKVGEVCLVAKYFLEVRDG